MSDARGGGNALIIIGFLGIGLFQMINALLATWLDLWPGTELEPALNIKSWVVVLLAESGICFGLVTTGFQSARGSAFVVLVAVMATLGCLANFAWLGLLL